MLDGNVIGMARPQQSGDRGNAGRGIFFADAVLDQSLLYFPGEHLGILAFVLFDFVLDIGRGDAGLATTDHTGPDAARLLVSVQDFGDAAVRHPQLPAKI